MPGHILVYPLWLYLLCLFSLGNLPVIIMGPQNFTVLITDDSPGRVEFSCVTEERADHQWITIVQGKLNTHKNPLNKTHSVYHVNINPFT